jgi:AbrB family looped-hinge helix DNA binding protein
MNTVTISPRYQLVIPRAVREQLKLVPGQTLQVIPYGDRIEFLPVRAASELRGILRGLDVSGECEDDHRR